MAKTSIVSCLAGLFFVGVAVRPDGEELMGGSQKYPSAASFIGDDDVDDDAPVTHQFPAQIITCSAGDPVLETKCSTLQAFRRVDGQMCSFEGDDGDHLFFDEEHFVETHAVETCKLKCEHDDACAGVEIVTAQSEGWNCTLYHSVAVEDLPEDMDPSDLDGISCFVKEDTYDRIVRIVTRKYHDLEHACNRTHCEKADFAGCVLRFAGHDLMDWDPDNNVGGSDACINFEDEDNKGLAPCLHIGEFGKGATIQHAYDEVCHEVSLADFVVAAAEALMMVTRPDWNEASMRSDSLDFAERFKFGRRTAEQCDPGPLPNPKESCAAVEDNFIKQLGLSWRGAAALMGVHTLGRASAGNSGFDGFWVSGEDARTFDNKYFINLLGAGWVPYQVPNPDHPEGGKFQWVRSDNGPTHEMMLNTDMCLLWSTNSGCKAEEDEDCCLWASVFGLKGAQSDCMVDENGEGYHQCYASMDDIGGTFTRPDGCKFATCCSHENMKTCGNDHMNPVGAYPAGEESAKAVTDFAQPETGDLAWIQEFKEVWQQVTVQNTAQKPENLFKASNCEIGLPLGSSPESSSGSSPLGSSPPGSSPPESSPLGSSPPEPPLR